MPIKEEEKQPGGIPPRIQLAARAAFMHPTTTLFQPVYRQTEITTVAETTTTTRNTSRRKRVANDESKNEDENSSDKTTVDVKKEIKKIKLTEATDRSLLSEDPYE